MARTKLSDIQLVLLTTAAGRADGSLLPPAESLGPVGARIRRALAALLKAELVEEKPVASIENSWRTEDDKPLGLFITTAGRQAIGVEEGAQPSEGEQAAPPTPVHQPTPAAVPDAPPPRGGSKQALVLELMRREEGATLAEMAAATGWLPHTTRAALTGLRKKGHSIVRGKRDEATCYTLGA